MRQWTLVLCALAALAACAPRESADGAAVRETLMQLFDKPDLPLVIDPIAVAGDAALAGWTQGSLGGRALLKRRGDGWSVELCAGDGIKSESALQAAGLTAEQSRSIVREIAEEESSVSAERLAAMRSFQGIVRMHAGHTENAAAGSEDTQHSTIEISAAVIPAPPPGATTAAGYPLIRNIGAQTIRLTSAETSVAARVSLHQNLIADGVVQMRPLEDGVLIPAGEQLSLEAGQRHLMLEDLERPLEAGEEISVTLHFTPISKVDAKFTVQSFADTQHGSESHHDH